MIETRPAEGELDLTACRDVEREPLWIEEVALLRSRGDLMCHEISVVPGHRGMERDDQEKGHEEILGLWNRDGGKRRRRLRRRAIMAGSAQRVERPEDISPEQSEHDTDE